MQYLLVDVNISCRQENNLQVFSYLDTIFEGCMIGVVGNY